MKTQTLLVRLEFSGELGESQRKEVLKNVMGGLVHTVDTAGIVPDDAEGFTETIKVTDVDSGVTLVHNVL